MSEPELVVIEHTHEPDAVNHEGEPTPLYRLVVGYVLEREVAKLDGNGNPIHREVEARDAEGNVIRDRILLGRDEGSGELIYEDGNPLLVNEPVTEQVSELVPVEDFVFAADDERWKGQSKEAIVAAQRDEVKKALAVRKREATRAANQRAERVNLPGTGEAL